MANKSTANKDSNRQEKGSKEKETTRNQKKASGKGKSESAKKAGTETKSGPSAEEKINELQERYLRLSAEFDNYRKRTLKEKTDLIKSAGESTLLKFIPVMDDFERAMISIRDAKDIEPVKQGIELIFTKFRETLVQQGVKEIDAYEKDFDTDLHEAVTKIPAPDEKLKGKVVDVIEKGYYLNDKVIRFSKVVIGE